MCSAGLFATDMFTSSVSEQTKMSSCPTWESELAKLAFSSSVPVGSSQEYSYSSPQVYLSYLSLFALLFIPDSKAFKSIFKYLTFKVQANLMFGSTGRNHGSFQVTAKILKKSYKVFDKKTLSVFSTACFTESFSN